MINLAKVFGEYAGHFIDFTRKKIARKRLSKIYHLYQSYTMVRPKMYVDNLLLIEEHKSVIGSVVECGVWRGGMSAGIAHMLGEERSYYLFDSFEGLPSAEAIDGPAALAYQANVTSPSYLDNCAAERGFAERAMSLSGARHFKLIEGWFKDTLPGFVPSEPIAVLRLDADWYESTITCLVNLYDHVVEGGLIIFDDYYTYDGCSIAVHTFLSSRNLPAKIEGNRHYGIAYIIKPLAA